MHYKSGRAARFVSFNIPEVFPRVCACMLMRCAAHRQVRAALTGSSTPYAWWGWAGLGTDCDTAYTRRWCPPPSAACASAGWCLWTKRGEGCVSAAPGTTLRAFVNFKNTKRFTVKWCLERKRKKNSNQSSAARRNLNVYWWRAQFQPD